MVTGGDAAAEPDQVGGVVVQTFPGFAVRHPGQVARIGALDDDRQTVTSRISAYTTVDLTARVQIGQGFDVSIAALNLFDRKPTAILTASPFDTPFDTTNYSAVGRFVGLTLRQKW